ncbi:hypothetical protein D3C76_1838960 [compost metagenome]
MPFFESLEGPHLPYPEPFVLHVPDNRLVVGGSVGLYLEKDIAPGPQSFHSIS